MVALWNIGPRASRAYSTLMLAARITLPHFSASSAMNLPKSEEESASTLPPEFKVMTLDRYRAGKPCFVFAPRTGTDYGFGWRRAVFHQ
jgi:hypothetical protein